MIWRRNEQFPKRKASSSPSNIQSTSSRPRRCRGRMCARPSCEWRAAWRSSTRRNRRTMSPPPPRPTRSWSKAPRLLKIHSMQNLATVAKSTRSVHVFTVKPPNWPFKHTQKIEPPYLYFGSLSEFTWLFSILETLFDFDHQNRYCLFSRYLSF